MATRARSDAVVGGAAATQRRGGAERCAGAGAWASAPLAGRRAAAQQPSKRTTPTTGAVEVTTMHEVVVAAGITATAASDGATETVGMIIRTVTTPRLSRIDQVVDRRAARHGAEVTGSRGAAKGQSLQAITNPARVEATAGARAR